MRHSAVELGDQDLVRQFGIGLAALGRIVFEHTAKRRWLGGWSF